MRRGFTLIELLVVVLIILAVSAVALPTVLYSVRERAVVGAASVLQATLAQVQAEALAAGSPRGFRLLPDESIPVPRLADGRIDPAAPLACDRWIPLETPPSYQEGSVSIYPGTAYPAAVTGGLPCLVLEQAPGHWERTGTGYTWILDAPTSWAWTIRAGDRVSLGAGSEYCVCGPMAIPPAGVTIGGAFQANPEQFVNHGPPGTAPPFTRTYTAPDGASNMTATPEFLLLVNGQDDDGDGFADNGWDGLDNDGRNGIDDAGEWEAEAWRPAQATGIVNAPYTIRRRPAPSSAAGTVILPPPVVVDLTTWGTTRERSRLPVNVWTGSVDVMIDPAGRPAWDLPYLARSSLGMDSSFAHFWLGSRADVPVLTPLPAPLPGPKEDCRLVSVTRLGRVQVTDVDPANTPDAFRRVQQGGR